MHTVATLLSSLLARDVCRQIDAKAGDGCWSLAKACGISQEDLVKFNPEPFSCDKIEVGTAICCSAGTLPDFSPQKQADGRCASYTVKEKDTCSSIGTAHKLKDWHKIDSFNGQTWSWSGCSSLQTGQQICLSEGTPPFPAEMKNAVCGPQVPNTKPPDGMAPTDWANLNPCPLNSCCNVWGQCGISAEFCTPSPADTKAPGTSKPGKTGCISNCGTDIANNKEKPDKIKRVGYFEAWNANKSCLSMDISKVDTDHYTHVHFAFGNLTSDWIPDISNAKQEFESFKKLKGTKKILSLGGWAFSTDPSTYKVFRTGVQEANRQKFSQSVVKFLKENELDGVDFDWEYPGAPDIPGIPADSRNSGSHYLEFLKLVRQQLDKEQTLSIAAPASYWYLQGMPIVNISSVVDYIVYMAYDLHGQWDFGNKYVDSGCPGGNCLRHQVNETEVGYSLAMITKAGVPAHKVLVGMALYGRSFKMTKPGCTSSNCTYVGPKSAAEPGRCTDTAGYLSNSEIFEIIHEANSTGRKIQQFYDSGDVLVYNDTQWVSYLTPASRAARQAFTDALNFGGTSDWAIDLDTTNMKKLDDDNELDADLEDDENFTSNFTICDYSITFDSLELLAAQAKYRRSDCLAGYTLQALIHTLDLAYKNYTAVNNGYDEMFDYYVKYMKKLVPEVAAQGFMFNASAAKPHTTPIPPILGQGMGFFDCKLKNGRTIPCTDFRNPDYLNLENRHETALTLKDEAGYNASLTAAGLDPDWVTLGDYHFKIDYLNPMQRTGGQTYKFKFKNFPVENEHMVIPNPKDIITKGLGSIPDLQYSMMATYMDIVLGQWVGGSMSDAMQAYSTPVFMLLQGIDSMQQAKDLGKKEKKNEAEEKKRKRDFILFIVSIALMFVPVVGEEIAMAAGFASLARAIAISGELGNAAVGIYDTVNDPKSAVVNILGMLLGVGAVARATRDGKGIADIAKIRQGMKEAEISAMGRIFKENDDTLQNIAKVCKLH